MPALPKHTQEKKKKKSSQARDKQTSALQTEVPLLQTPVHQLPSSLMTPPDSLNSPSSSPSSTFTPTADRSSSQSATITRSQPLFASPTHTSVTGQSLPLPLPISLPKLLQEFFNSGKSDAGKKKRKKAVISVSGRNPKIKQGNKGKRLKKQRSKSMTASKALAVVTQEIRRLTNVVEKAIAVRPPPDVLRPESFRMPDNLPEVAVKEMQQEFEREWQMGQEEIAALSAEQEKRLQAAEANLRNLQSLLTDAKKPIVKQEPGVSSAAAESHWQSLYHEMDDGDEDSCLMLCTGCHVKVAEIECCKRGKFCDRDCLLRNWSTHAKGHIGRSLFDYQEVIVEGDEEEEAVAVVPDVQMEQQLEFESQDEPLVPDAGPVPEDTVPDAAAAEQKAADDGDEDEETDIELEADDEDIVPEEQDMIETLDLVPDSVPPPPSADPDVILDLSDDEDMVIEEEPIAGPSDAQSNSLESVMDVAEEDLLYEWQESVKVEKVDAPVVTAADVKPVMPLRAGPRRWKIEQGIEVGPEQLSAPVVPIAPIVIDVDDDPIDVVLLDDDSGHSSDAHIADVVDLI